MVTRTTRVVLGVSAALALSLLSPVGPTSHGVAHARGDDDYGASPPNVLLIVADDVGVDKVSSYADDFGVSYGSTAEYLPTTLNIDAMAAAGARFTDAWANPSCSPTRAAILTGRHSFRTDVGGPVGRAGAAALDTDLTSLADMAVSQGYTTGLFGKWHLGDEGSPAGWGAEESWMDHTDVVYPVAVHPIMMGFDRFVGTLGGSLDRSDTGTGYYDYINVSAGYCETCSPQHTAMSHRYDEYVTDKTVRDAAQWIRRQRGSWMAVVALHAAHDPWDSVPDGCAYRRPGESAPSSTIGTYEEIVECMDRNIGELLDSIPDLEDTVVVFIGDNGSPRKVAEGVFIDHRGKGTPYESGLRVPLIVADGAAIAATRSGTRVEDLEVATDAVVAYPGMEIHDAVHAVDLYATLGEVMGAETDGGLDSVSFTSLLHDEHTLGREFNYAEYFTPDHQGFASLRLANYKLIVNVEMVSSGRCRSDYKLYDLDSDRFEMTDIIDDEPEVFATLLTELDYIATEDGASWLDLDDC